jgi:hypothetical protein
MARLEIVGAELVVRLSRLERVGAFSPEPHVPLSSIRSVRAAADPWRELRGIRAPGTGWPGVIALGTRRHGGRKDFCAVYGKGPGVVVELAGAPFERFVVSAAHREAVADSLRSTAASQP